ncbi:uncharacterized protein PG986_000525 [Apiospora aurea]|uniref:Uncharacterized protein n=1 Tax=Apiospora aurea TaxID=335848 RepID=A0ABR1QUC6_9PEZI
MHLLSVSVLVGLASSACGNFWAFEEGDSSGKTLYPGYRFFNESDPNCDEVKSAICWQVQDDVTGDKKGVRAEGTDLLSPDILEVHVDNVYFRLFLSKALGLIDTFYLIAIYKHINYAIYDVEANYRGFASQSPASSMTVWVARPHPSAAPYITAPATTLRQT